MPGIFGIIGTGNPHKNEGDLFSMLKGVLHEPFYRHGTYINSHLGIWVGWTSHSRSLPDIMPIWNETNDTCIIFSGENYVEPEDVTSLKAKGHDFGLRDDCYLVHLYEELGRGFFEKLNGRFSGVIVNLGKPNLLLFNDRFGLDRIYYHEKDGKLYFSSEAKSLLKVLPELKQIDASSLAQTYSCGCTLQNRTLFSGISLIPGGSLWRYEPGRALIKDSYFSPVAWEEQEPLGCSEFSQRLKEVWRRVLPRYIRGEGRVAVSLTGGKDSRMIMAWAKCPPQTLPCYTFSGPYRECRDARLARLVANICGQSHSIITVDGTFLDDFPSLAERTVYLTDGTMDVSGSVELFVNRLARQIAPIRLTGNYGQEILRSDVSFGPMPMDTKILDNDFAGLVKNAARTYFHEFECNRLSFVAFKQVPWHHYSRLALELSQLTLRSPFLDNNMVSLSYRMPKELVGDIRTQLQLISEGNPALAKIGTDRASYYKSIPLLSKAMHLYQEFLFKAEYAYDYGMPQLLVLFNRLLEPVHPEKLFLGRHKFYHFRIWYRRELSEYIKEILLDSRTKKRSFLKAQSLEKMVIAHTKGTANFTSEIHRILTCELFHRIFID